jgi:uncharacterized cupredoxin-like copper-binding protein
MTTAERLLRSVAALSLAATAWALPGTALADAGHAHGAAIGEPAKASAATRTVKVTLGDNFYEPETIQVKAGETVRFVLTNKGELLHEFNIGTAAMHAEHQKEMAMMVDHGMLTVTSDNSGMSEMDHSKMGGMDMSAMKHDDPNSVLVEPGKTKELIWKFPKATDLDFACNMPGHYEAGMVGKIEFRR